MTWIRFDPYEPPAPMQRLAQITTGAFDPARLNVQSICPVIFFAHGLDCPHCRAAIQGFAGIKDRLMECEAEVFAVVPQAGQEDLKAFEPVRVVVDPNGLVRKDFAGLLEFDTDGKLLLFILNQGGAPSAAWVGDEADDPSLHDYTLKRLDYISVQCPE